MLPPCPSLHLCQQPRPCPCPHCWPYSPADLQPDPCYTTGIPSLRSADSDPACSPSTHSSPHCSWGGATCPFKRASWSESHAGNQHIPPRHSRWTDHPLPISQRYADVNRRITIPCSVGWAGGFFFFLPTIIVVTSIKSSRMFI